MLRYFCKSKKGSITIMLTIVMAAIIASTSVLVEMGKYHSTKALYREMTDNAAFSTLAHYDEDLYNQYGLFAMEQSVSADAAIFDQYLSANMNLNNGNASLIDSNMVLGTTDFKGIYPLGNGDVLKYQIQEYAKYRGPIYMANEGLDLEEKLSGFISDLESKVPMLNEIEKQTGNMENFTNVAVSVQEFAEEIKGLKDLYTDYKSCVDAFNEAINALHALDSEAEDYEEQKEDAINKINECGSAVKSAIGSVKAKKEALVKSWETVKADMATFKESVTDSETSAEGEQSEQADYYEESDKTTEDTIDKVNKTIDGIETTDIDNFFTGLEEQISTVKEGEEASSITAVDFFADEVAIDELYAEVVNYSDKVKTEFNTYVNQIKGLISISEAMINGGKSANPDLNNTMTITDAVNTSAMPSNADLEADLQLLEQQREELKSIMGEGTTDRDALIDAMNDFVESLEKLQEGLEEFPTTYQWNVFSLFRKMKEVAKASLNFVQAMNRLVQEFIAAGPQGIAKSLYSVLMLDTYATTMFSTRITDIDEEKNMSGNSFPNKMTEGSTAGWFDKADVEYIFAGKSSEADNQKIVYNFLFGFRFLLNIIPVLNDSLVKTVRQALGMVPYIGAFLSIVVVLLWIVVESFIDMQVLINLRGDVPLLKGDYIFLSAEGLTKPEDGLIAMIGSRVNDLAEELDVDTEKLKGMISGFENSAKESGGTDTKKPGSSFISGNLLPMNYREYLIVALLFSGTNNMLSRMGNLIEADMRRVKGDQSYRLASSFTYIRVKTEASYKPLLPILTILGVNSQGLKVESLDYCGY